MTPEETLNTYDLFDATILSHGFSAYMRDYQITAKVHQGNPSGVYVFMLQGCVESHYEPSISPHAFSMDDELLDLQKMKKAHKIDAFRWGVKGAEIYPGWTYFSNSQKAKVWTEKMGYSMHEVKFETNVYKLNIIFHNLKVTQPDL